MYQNKKEKTQKLLCNLNKEKENLQKQTTNLMQNNNADHLAQANNHLKRNLESSQFKIKDLNYQIDSLKLVINDLVDLVGMS